MRMTLMISSARDATIGKRIAAIREHRGLSQAALADAIGATKSIVFHIDHGHTPVSLDLAERAVALHCTVNHLRAPLDAPMSRTRLRGRRGDFVPAWNEVRTATRRGA
jgi:transcriptional regulator with XRE-family HTH domain